MRRAKMIKSIDEELDRKPEIDLTGPDGNAFFLFGLASRWAKDLGKNEKKILDDMKSGDYEHLLEVMEREFGEYVIFYR
jgi:tRNA U54 and U55 pseudouridine synthase Pus10